jgi:hypothetical protein
MEQRFSITVRGRLGADFADAFGDIDVTSLSEQTVIAGRLIDQAHLDGILAYLRNLGVEMIAVNTRVETGAIDEAAMRSDRETATEGVKQ